MRSATASLPWLRLLPSLALIAAGIALVNQVEIGHLRARHASRCRPLRAGRAAGGGRGGLLDLVPAPQCRLAARPCRPLARAPGPRRRASPRCRWRWSAIWAAGPGLRPAATPSPMPFGPTPAEFLGLMFAIGLLASWLGTLCWNEASQRLPTTLVGPADRLRDAVGARLCLHAARQDARAGRRWPASRCWWPACCGRCACGPSRQWCTAHDAGMRQFAVSAWLHQPRPQRTSMPCSRARMISSASRHDAVDQLLARSARRGSGRRPCRRPGAGIHRRPRCMILG